MKGVKYLPCDNCPFRKNQGYLTKGRARELAQNQLSWDGDAFWCHKTVDHVEDVPVTENAQHCGGALIFSEKNEVSTQCMRIAGRLGLYDPSKLQEASEIYDSLDEMVENHGR